MVKATILAPILLLATQLSGPAAEAPVTRLSAYVRPFVGTEGEGNTYPGPSAPFGMMQLSPDTDKELWETASGYEYSDPTIFGFSLTHLSGTGIPDLGDFLFVPQVGDVKLTSGTKGDATSGYLSAYSHQDEKASAGYYEVKLQKSGVTVELTAGDRAGIMRFTFPASEQSSILIDLQHILSGKKWTVVWSHLRQEDDSTVTGYHLVNGWAKERRLYFAAHFSRPFDKAQIFSDGKPVIYNTYRFRSSKEAAGANLQFVATYKTKEQEPILVKVAVSAVSAANARKNLESEIAGWDFETLQEKTRARWDQELGRIEVEGSQEEKETFYTSLYHAFLAPNLFEDVTGEYRGLDQNVHEAKGFTNYTVFSLWDTYRATHPLFALIQAPRDADMIKSMLAHYDQSVEHMLPIWSLQANETWCMIGYHAVPVIADAFFKGVKGFDAERAYEAAKTTAMNPHYDSVATYTKLGWVPFDQENESVSKTLEYAYDDYCIAQMARALGKKKDAAYFSTRAASYKNLFDPSVGLMRGKDSAGHWHTPFNPHSYDESAGVNDFTEGTSWQYSWYVPQDVPGLINLMGGKKKFAEKLDALFTFKEADQSKGVSDIQGRIGEYWHGNEPSHHVIYLYSYAGQPWKAAERLRQVVKSFYGNKPNSLSGNDDCGQMSAWYIFTCLGFYPVCPASSYYVIGAPQLKKIVLNLSNGKKFTMKANNLSDANKYVQSVAVNGKPLEQPFLPFDEIRNGGTIIFTMGPKPSEWGINPQIPK
ncbi:MAG TPA: GH92 family glycosyl hydrolase [Chthoniobacterales bacterium]